MLTDQNDKKILAMLRHNSRTSVSDIARKLKLSRSTVKDRIDRLETKGIIKGYSLLLSDEYTTGNISAHVMIKLASGRPPTIIKHLQKFDQIRTAYAVSGSYDLIIIVEAESTKELDDVIDRVREFDVIKDTLSSVVLSTKFRR